MAKSVKNKHMTLDDRRIIETGIINGSSKVSIADTIGKILPLLEKKYSIAELRNIISRYLWNAVLIRNVLTEETAKRIVLIMSLSNVRAEIAPLVLVTVVQNTLIAALINSHIELMHLITNTEILLWILVKASI